MDMYLWRKLNEKQRAELLAFRRFNARHWHSPQHRENLNGRYLLTAACFEHHHFIGRTPKRMSDFTEQLLELLETNCEELYAWCLLPNHYHAVVLTRKFGRERAIQLWNEYPVGEYGKSWDPPDL